ncbi:NAD(P)-dependent oxidoreductase [Desertihabitans brevis]|uniref:NAD(P)-dependent oxidoreductase n=1 Tax=Desertihabitans brevis TaxID=2268447 RepID=A0A367YQL6_9ACTN|nr:NAD(P)-dependent oxidoreductase [Desertihabitans brevis]RCK68185.1 NAD(P)-dependent oxidoreductase [Desertihabitans brevis]
MTTTGDALPGAGRTVLVTGAAGHLGSRSAATLAAAGFELRLLDVVEPADPPAGAEVLVGSVTDADLVARGCADVAAVLHYGGIPVEDAWEDILDVNINGTRTVLEGARHAGAAKVLLASSNHAAGFQHRDSAPPTGLPPTCVPLADTYYGVSKAAMEALGALYHHRFGIDVLALRIGSCTDSPSGSRALSTWFAPADLDAMLLAWLADEDVDFRLAWGISANTRGWFDLSTTPVAGYTSRHDAERDLPELAAAYPPDQVDPEALPYLGGPFTQTELGSAMPRP